MNNTNSNRFFRTCAGILAFLLVAILVSCGKHGKDGRTEFVQGEAAYADMDYKTAAQLFLDAAEKGNAEAQVSIGDCYWNGQGVKQDDAQALQWYFEAAKQMNPKGLYRIGVCYEEGRGVTKDPEAAARWYQKAAGQQYPEAYFKLGDCCRLGRGMSMDEKAANKWYQKAVKAWAEAAEQGDAGAQYRLGECFSRGFGVEQNHTEAIAWYNKAAEQGHAGAQFELAKRFEEGIGGTIRNEFKAAEWYRKAAEHGHAGAQHRLAMRYETGNGVAVNLTEALKWYRKVAEQGSTNKDLLSKIDSLNRFVYQQKMAEQGDIEAMLKLAAQFEEGNGVPKDLSEAVKWYRKSANLGSAESQLELAKRYETGTGGVSKDDAEAAKWYHRAAEQGNAIAQYMFAECCFYGRGVSKNQTEAVKWYRKAAEQGHAGAQSELGCCYSTGFGTDKDYNEAFQWYRKAAEQGIAKAQNNLGTFYSRGIATDKDDAEAVKWFRKAAEQNFVGAQHNLGVCYQNGYGVSQNEAEAVKWYRKAAEQNFVNAMTSLGQCYYKGEGVSRNLVEAIKWFRKAADNGDAEAQTELGICYYKGEGVNRNLAEAVEWWHLAANQGDATAQYNLALCYYFGYGVNKDYSEAVKWYRKAADQGNAEAQFCVGNMYYNGEGARTDYGEALKWYRMAAEQGYAMASLEIAKQYENGKGIQKDYAEALNWYRKAAEQGQPVDQAKIDFLQDIVDSSEKNGTEKAEAMFKIAERFKNGKGVFKDPEEAVEWYRKAAEQGHAEAQYTLGVCYFNGRGTGRNEFEAVKWYRKAAEQGIVEAQFQLGMCFFDGTGVSKDEKEAVNWFHKAAEQGYAEAQNQLGLCFVEGKGVTQDSAEAAKWFRKAAGQGYPEASKHLQLAEMLFAAQNGDANAQYKLAQAYEFGAGVSKDLTEAVKWYRKAAEQGIVEAQFQLGMCFFDGTGVSKDEKEAVNWFHKAAEQGYAKAQYWLSICYDEGIGVTKNWFKSMDWSEKALITTTPAKWSRPQLQPADKTIFLTGNVTLDLVKVEAGTFTMGAMVTENAPEGVHQVSLKKDFYLSRTEITQEQWKTVMGSNPSEFKGDDLPVEQVSWNDAISFCKKLNSMVIVPNGWMFTLPTETQWEYAARGGKKSKGYKYSGSNIIREVAWHEYNTGFTTRPVGLLKANELGLYDMSGNVFEWCLDDWNEDIRKQTAEFARGNSQLDSDRVIRGGAWAASDKGCCSGYRGHQNPGERRSNFGFRVALVPLAYDSNTTLINNNGDPLPAETVRETMSPSSRETISPTPTRQSQSLSEIQKISFPNDVTMVFIKVEAGTFTMSEFDGENDHSTEVAHQVTLKKDFYISQTEVTQAQWESVMGNNPSYHKYKLFSVECVSWNDAMLFCAKLNLTDKVPNGWEFTLPTETQWEYAARGGKKSKGYKYSGSDNIDEVAWYKSNSSSKTHLVGQKKPNELGLYDMCGNVEEWCLDDWNTDSSKQKPEFTLANDSAEHVTRGGSYLYRASSCRSSFRYRFGPRARNAYLGFRVALVPVQ